MTEPETGFYIEIESPKCARCYLLWEVQYDGENLCRACRDKLTLPPAVALLVDACRGTYPDLDIEELRRYAKKRGQIWFVHHEYYGTVSGLCTNAEARAMYDRGGRMSYAAYRREFERLATEVSREDLEAAIAELGTTGGI